MKSLAVCYWYVKLPLCGYMERGLEYITFYVKKKQKNGTFSSLFWSPAGSRRAARGARICEICQF